MDIFLKLIAAILVAVILTLTLSKQGADISLLLTVAVCCMVITAALSYFQPVFAFAHRLIDIGNLNTELLDVVMKVVGIGMISQIATLICADSGNQAMGKAVQIMTIAVILCLSIPVLEQMLTLIEMVMGEV